MKNIVALICFCLVLSCKSAQEKFNDRNFKGAFYSALKDIDKNPQDNKSINLLNKAYKSYTGEYLITYNKLELYTKVNDKIEVYKTNQEIEKMLLEASQYLRPESGPGASDIALQKSIIGRDISEYYLSEAMPKFIKADRNTDVNLARDAYEDFANANKYSPKDESIIDQLEACLKLATLTTFVEVEFWANDYSSYDVDRAFDDLQNTNDKFDKIYYKHKGPENIDCEMRVNLSNVDYDTDQSSTNQNFAKEIIDRYEKVMDANGNTIEKPIYKTVSGSVTTFKKRRVARAYADVRIRERTDKCKLRSEQRLTEDVSQDIVEYRISGDPRAIPSNYQNSNTVYFKSDDDFESELLQKLANRIRSDYF